MCDWKMLVFRSDILSRNNGGGGGKIRREGTKVTEEGNRNDTVRRQKAEEKRKYSESRQPI